ncbi:MAG: TatD family hydrolase [Marinospirillum sp.]|uniref:TatD family hydrolase n=1 Tax=Marinospirillum sp. TaxID=2183934 RepID=UPI0019D9B994|nr:TatD family hydrolase [Marinospirillum sp.]MBE0507746.1 TatD family hydrolase [Marinospirillum sp.]
MQLADAHCHLDFPEFDADRDQVLIKARAAGIRQIILPATTAKRWDGLLKLASTDPQLYPCLGLHPMFMTQHRSEDLDALKQALQQNPQVVAVGEIGVDFWHDPTAEQQTQQWQLLDAQLDLAKDFNLPVVLHIRKGMDEVIRRLRKKHLTCGGLVHAFSGSLQQAQQLVNLGFRLGLGGSLTYPRARRLRHIASQLPATAFLLETDSPDMPLAGQQGQRNEPANIVKVLNCWADLRQTPAAELALELQNNLQQTFPKTFPKTFPLQKTH